MTWLIAFRLPDNVELAPAATPYRRKVERLSANRIGVNQLAREAGVSKPTASKFIRGTSTEPFQMPTFEKLEATWIKLGGTVVGGMAIQPGRTATIIQKLRPFRRL